MQWSLFVLILMGQCCFFMCQLYEYHFIKEKKTWEEAQNYCRENYTDLATVYDMTDMERLKSEMTQGEAWIGLYDNSEEQNRTWHWSLPGLEYNDTEKQWADDEPDDSQGPENCVGIDSDKLWYDIKCSEKRGFICYNETKQPNDPYCVFYEENFTWLQAQKYCREHHTDLISGLNQLNQFNNITNVSGRFWIGLFRDTWRWSDGSNSSFRNWDHEVRERNKKCALLESSGKWRSAPCNARKSFFCYDDEVILIKENKTWDEAVEYCSDHHHGLVSITNPHQQSRVQERAKNADTPYVWLGLRFSCVLDLWFWVNDQLVCYDNWDPEENTETCAMAAAMKKGGDKWVRQDDTSEFNFICALH